MCLACDLSTKNNRYNISRRSLVGGAATVFATSALFESTSSIKAKELSAKNQKYVAKPIVIIAGSFWDGKTEKPQGQTEILVENGRVSEIGTKVNRPDTAEIISLLEHFVMPGFIDTHVHVTLRPELNGSIFDVSSSKKALLGAHALNNLLMNGFTTVRDVGDMDVHGYTTSDLSKSIAEGLIIGSRLISSGHLISARGGHGDGRGLLASDSLPWQNSLADGVSELRSVVRDEISRGAKWIKFAGSGGFGSPSDDPNQVTYSQEEMNVIVSTAKDLGIPATLHVYEDEGIRRALKAGVTSIEHANLASKKTLDLISKNNVYVVPTQITVLKQARMANNDKFWEEAGRPDFVRKKYQKYSQQLLDSANNLANSDVKIVFGSDIGTFSFEKNNAEEFSEMVSNGISPARALKAGTSIAAEMLDMKDIGIIKVGNRADIIAINGNPFENIRATESVLFVMQDGLVRKELKA